VAKRVFPFALAALLLVALPGVAHAYIGPGAGFALTRGFHVEIPRNPSRRK